MMRSDSISASRRLWVTIKAVVGRADHTVNKQMAQPLGGLFVERDEGFVQEKDRRFGGEGPGERCPAGKAERKLRREERAHAGEAETVEQPVEVGIPQALRQSKPDILLDRPPRQQGRLLEHGGDAVRAAFRQLEGAGKVLVEAKQDAQRRGLAAARRPEQAGEFALPDLEGKVAQRRDRDAFRRPESLFGDVDPKRDAGANGLHVVQRAAPGEVR